MNFMLINFLFFYYAPQTNSKQNTESHREKAMLACLFSFNNFILLNNSFKNCTISFFIFAMNILLRSTQNGQNHKAN